MIGPVGPCGWVHTVGMAERADSRFDATTPVRYRAVSGGPLRATRDAAIADECATSHRGATS
jgi:hypothetical protein